MKKLRELFTKWYIKRGYTWECKPIIPGIEPDSYFDCDWYIRPLTFLFSPDVYAEHTSYYVWDGGEEPLIDPVTFNNKEVEPRACPVCGDKADIWIEENKRLGLDLCYCGCKKCGYRRFSYTYGRNGAVIRWNDFVEGWVENSDEPVFSNEELED